MSQLLAATMLLLSFPALSFPADDTLGVQPQLETLVSQARSFPVSRDGVRALISFVQRNPATISEVPEDLVSSALSRKVFGDELAAQAEMLLSSRPSAEVIPLRNLAIRLGGGSLQDFPRFADLLSLAETAERAAAAGDEAMFPMLRDKARSLAETSIISGYLNRLLLSKATAAFRSDKPEEALRVLAQVEPQTRSAEILALIRESIAKIQGNAGVLASSVADVLSRTDVAEMLRGATESDPATQVLLADTYSKLVLASVREGNAKRANEFFIRVIALRADPSRLNNSLRMTVALDASNDETRSFAKGRIAELSRQNALTFFDKQRLLFRGYYGKALPIFLGSSVTVLFLVAVLSFLRPSLFHLRLPTVPRSFPKKQRVVPGYMRNVQAEREDEYSRLLANFGLTDEVSEEDIKREYRSLMKRYHPDSQNSIDPKNLERFRELQFSYERIMEIRRSWFGGRK